MTRLILIRHGETDWNVEGRWQGQVDVPLNARGHEQALALARSLAGEGIQAIYSSDLSRATGTAQAIAQVTGLSVRLEPRLREIHQGEWQGLLVTEIEARYGEAFRQRQDNPLAVSPPGGESVEKVSQRVINAVNEILARHPHEVVAIVSHGFALALVRVHFEGCSIDQVWERIPQNAGWLAIEG